MDKLDDIELEVGHLSAHDGSDLEDWLRKASGYITEAANCLEWAMEAIKDEN